MKLTDEPRAYLDEPRFAVAATVSGDGTPHQTVVWYALDGDAVIVSTPNGSRKHRHLLRDPRLSLCVEEGFRYATLSGRATIEDEPASAGELYARMGNATGERCQRDPPAEARPGWTPGPPSCSPEKG